MPELPEVETLTNDLKHADLIGKKIIRVEVFWPKTVVDEKKFSKIVYQTIKSISRRGKFLVFTLTDYTLLVHLRMTGKFFIESKETAPHPHERVRLYLNDKRILRYEDQRKFGRWFLTSQPEKILGEIGLEPLSKTFTLDAFKKLIELHHRQIKPFLLDQHFVAGLGNIYVDESLWEAKIHPQTLTSDLSLNEIKALHQAIPLILKRGIKHKGTTLGSTRANYYSVSGRRGANQDQLKVFRRDEMPCPRCHTLIKKITVAQRGTHFCPHCQINH